MSTKNSLLAPAAPERDEDVFAKLPKQDRFELKKLDLSTELVALMAYCHETRSSIAERLGWKKSRLTHLLSGRANPTVRTIYEFASCVGYDVDVVFRKADQDRLPQPWEQISLQSLPAPSQSAKYVVVFQAVEDLVSDYTAGTAQPFYIKAIYNSDGEPAVRAKEFPKELAPESSRWLPSPAADGNEYLRSFSQPIAAKA